LSHTPKKRSTCFSKFPRTANPVDLVTHVGGLLRIEIETQQPSGKPSLHRENIRFQFNAALLRDDYELPPKVAQTVAEHTAELQLDVASFINSVHLMSTLFPDVLAGSDSSRQAAREAAKHVLAYDTDALRGFYGQLKLPNAQRPLPPAASVTPDWALFRWLQVKLLFALDVYCRYGGRLPEPLSPKLYEKMEHDVLDAQYLILGVLERSFATRETKLKEWWALICPNGALYE